MRHVFADTYYWIALLGGPTPSTQSRRRRRRTAISPSPPIPARMKVEGSGTGFGWPRRRVQWLLPAAPTRHFRSKSPSNLWSYRRGYKQNKRGFRVTSDETVETSPHREIASGGNRHAVGLEVGR